MGAADLGGAPDQTGARRPRQRAERDLAACSHEGRAWRMRCTPSACGAATNGCCATSPGSCSPASAGRCSATTAPARRSCSSCLSGDVWPTPTRATAAQCVAATALGRQAIDSSTPKPRIAYLGAERQDKYARYGWNLRVRDLVATGLHRTDLLLCRSRGRSRAGGRVLRACGSERLAAREFLSLSYGEKRLALLARALVQEPDWLLLDELYNGLDRRLPAAHRRGAGSGAPPRPVLGCDRASRDGRAAQERDALMELREGRIRADQTPAGARTSRACGERAG